MSKQERLRLHVYLARAGVASRRKCESYIADGRIKVNDRLVTRPGTVVSEFDRVAFDDEIVRPTDDLLYLALHKPVRYICSNSDEKGRPRALDLLSEYRDFRIYSVGRLDYLSSGLIFFTNDGEFTRFVSHPSNSVEKEYLVKTLDSIPDSLLESYSRGIEIQGTVYTLKEYSRTSRYSLRLTLVEGRNREIRRVFDFFDVRIKSLHRLRIGIVSLGNLKAGEYRKLNKEEIDYFLSRQAAG